MEHRLVVDPLDVEGQRQVLADLPAGLRRLTKEVLRLARARAIGAKAEVVVGHRNDPRGAHRLDATGAEVRIDVIIALGRLDTRPTAPRVTYPLPVHIPLGHRRVYALQGRHPADTTP